MMNTINYRKENEPWNYIHKTSIQKHTLSNRALLHQFLKLGKFVCRDFLHSMIQQVTGSLDFIFIKNLPFLLQSVS